MSVDLPVRIHATSIAVEGSAAIIRGASGTGKSDLALRCLTMAPGALTAGPAVLVADDYTELYLEDGELRARAPAEIANLMEVRGLGVMEVPALESARAALVVDLAEPSTIERLPLGANEIDVVGYTLPMLRLAAFEASSPAKLLLALDFVRRHGRLPGAG
ncbi:MAG: HPr kinase/phosphatase C-terminal domain-containing protein [Alphaproteobacteria bacterium]|nr:HPr kinase/phosphatase C-terminal domain-containing protein [Alphaproteobacteria bacterium]